MHRLHVGGNAEASCASAVWSVPLLAKACYVSSLKTAGELSHARLEKQESRRFGSARREPDEVQLVDLALSPGRVRPQPGRTGGRNPND